MPRYHKFKIKERPIFDISPPPPPQFLYYRTNPRHHAINSRKPIRLWTLSFPYYMANRFWNWGESGKEFVKSLERMEGCAVEETQKFHSESSHFLLEDPGQYLCRCTQTIKLLFQLVSEISASPVWPPHMTNWFGNLREDRRQLMIGLRRWICESALLLKQIQNSRHH